MKNYSAINISLWQNRVGPARINAGLVLFFLSGLFLLVGLLQLICAGVSLYFNDNQHWNFFIPGIIEFVIGSLGFYLTRPTRKDFLIRARDVTLTVTLVWLIAALLGSIPFLVTNTLPSFSKAFFEAMCGFTTAGFNSFAQLEGVPKSVLFWRSLTQWLGGLGIIVLLVGVAPAIGGLASKLLLTEVPGVSKERMTPRIIDTAKILLRIYVLMTLLGFVAFYLAGMTGFDALNHSMTILPTAGFMTHTESLGYYNSSLIEFIAICLMLIGSINFAVYWRLATRRQIEKLIYLEIYVFFGILLTCFGLITASIYFQGDVATFSQAVRDAGFTVVSIMSTTGIVSTDFDQWNDFARVLLIFLMFIGGCSGSTTGGLRVLRWMILFTVFRNQITKVTHPGLVTAFRIGKKTFHPSLITMCLGLITMHFLIFFAGSLLMMAAGNDAMTSLSSVAAALNLSGVGFGAAGATETMSELSDFSLTICSIMMLLGRLEIFTVIALLMPAFWRKD